MKWLLFAAAGLVLLGLVVTALGALLPRTHIASRSAVIHQAPEVLFATMRDFAAHPSWRQGVKSIEILPPRDGHTTYREISRHGAITYLVSEEIAPRSLVTKIADENLPFGGTWTIELLAAGSATTVRITEQGEVKNPVFRFMARFIFGHTATIDSYLRELGKKFGESVTPQSKTPGNPGH
jgi:hypothetical protein